MFRSQLVARRLTHLRDVQFVQLEESLDDQALESPESALISPCRNILMRLLEGSIQTVPAPLVAEALFDRSDVSCQVLNLLLLNCVS